MCNDTKEWWKIWRGIDLSFQNWHEEFNQFWTEHSKISKICTLMGYFWPKYTMFELKKVQRNYLSWHWRVMQNLKKIDLWFGKWHEEFGRFSPEHSKIWKLGLWWDPFIQSRKCMSLKFTGELCVMTMKNNAKFEEELTCQFKIDMRNLTNFNLSTRKSQNIAL